MTYQGWGEAEGKRIDYFMVSMTGLRVNSYDVLSETHGGIYSSDHNPIVMTAVLEYEESPHLRVWTLVISDGF